MTTNTEPLKVGELKPCPFCGGEAHLRAIGRDWWRIGADHDDECYLVGTVEDSPQTDEQRDLLIAAWNRRTKPSPAEVSSEPIYQARNKSEKQWSEVSKAKFDFYADAPEIGVEVRTLYLRQDSAQQVAAPCGCLIDGEEDQAEWCQRHLALKCQLGSIASAQRYELDDASGSMVPREDGQWIQHAYLKSTGARQAQQSPARVESQQSAVLAEYINRIRVAHAAGEDIGGILAQAKAYCTDKGVS